MRYSCLVLTGVLMLCTVLSAQQPAQPRSAAPILDPNNRLDSLLMKWEAKMKSIQTLRARVSRERWDKVFNTRDIFAGETKYMRPNLALLNLSRKDRPTIFEKYICTGTLLYEFNQANREVRYQELPPPKPGQVADDNFLSFALGMKAEEAKRRYELRLAGEDRNYYYVEILPRFPADKADFQTARLVLTKSTFLPRELTFVEPNGNIIKWDIPFIETGIPLDRREFERPTIPKDWRLVKAPKANSVQAPGNNQLPPRIVRPKQ